MLNSYNLALFLIATKKYYNFAINLINSADQFFCLDHKVHYFLFTDIEKETITSLTNRKITYSYIEHKPWPSMTLERYHIFKQHQKLFEDMDYVFYSDADMLFVDIVGSEILSDLTFTQHPGYTGTRGTPETNPMSLAYVSPYEHMQYFAGGFNGGKRSEYLKMAETISKNIDRDRSNNIIAVWHDESHMNRYAIDHPPTNILNPGYCYPENWQLPFPKKILALDKNHSSMREIS